MAEVAIGVNCPGCQTLNAASGAYGDETLHAQCGCCGSPITVTNHKYIPGLAPAFASGEMIAAAAPAPSSVAADDQPQDETPQQLEDVSADA